jgi:hypothetical protein
MSVSAYQFAQQFGEGTLRQRLAQINRKEIPDAP